MKRLGLASDTHRGSSNHSCPNSSNAATALHAPLNFLKPLQRMQGGPSGWARLHTGSVTYLISRQCSLHCPVIQ